MSDIYVKSLFMRPQLNALTGLPATIFFVISYNAISGLPHGPYTVKNLRPILCKPDILN